MPAVWDVARASDRPRRPMTPPVAQASSRNKIQPKRPSMIDALGEFRVPLEASIYWLGALSHPWPHAKPHNAKVVMLIPGFMAGDMTLAPLANFCRWLGHRAVYAGILSNSEIAREHPEMVERVITLGSPIRMPRRHANLAVQAVARSVAAIRGRAEGCLSESCQCGLMLSDESPAGVPTTHVYSRTDGVVHWESCVDLSGAPTVENVEVMGSHVGMGVNDDVYRVIADRLSMPRRSRLHAAESHADAS